MERATNALPPRHAATEGTGRRLMLYYAVEGLASVAATLLTVGIFFFTEARFGWKLKQNFILAATQGAVYVVGALLANGLTARLGRRRMLACVYLAMALAAGLALSNVTPPAVVTALLAYTFLSATAWPALESLVSSGIADPHEMSRRLGVYNLVWSGTGAVALAVNGWIIQHWWRGVFVLPMVLHVVVAALIWMSGPEPAAVAASAVQGKPEPALKRQRRLALVLSRIALPATYMVIYALAPLMPMLSVVNRLNPAAQTVLASVWLATRWLTFWVLGATSAWHTRPRLLFWAACVMLVAFLGIALPPGELFKEAKVPFALDLASIILWQAILGVALGMIYAGSLYFGMVLSEGSTEHGGYHEALIGAGFVLGPGTGAVALVLTRNNMSMAIAAIGAVVSGSVMAAAAASIKASRAEE